MPVLLWSKGVEIRGDFSDPFDPSSGCETGVWSWLLEAIFGANGVKVVGVRGGLETDFLQCDSIVGLILGDPIGIEDGGRRGGAGCCAPPFSLFDIVEILTVVTGYVHAGVTSVVKILILLKNREIPFKNCRNPQT